MPSPRTLFNRNILHLASVLILLSCKPDLPDGIISERRMEDILYDYHIAQGMADAAPKDADYTSDGLLYEFQQAALSKHGVTEAEFDSSMAYYCSDLTRLSRIYSHVSKRLEKTADAYGVVTSPADSYNALSAIGDTANVWAEQSLYVVKPNALENLQGWQMECDTTWHSGDDVMWRFACNMLSKENINSQLHYDLVVTYTNDSVRSTLNSTRVTRSTEARIHTPYDWTPRTIAGHLFVPVSDAACFFIVKQPMLIRFHKKDVHPQPQPAVQDSTATAASADSTATVLTADSMPSDPAMQDARPTELQRLPREHRVPREHRHPDNQLQNNQRPTNQRIRSLQR